MVMNYRRTIALFFSLFLASHAFGQSLDYATMPNSPAYESAALELRNAPPSEFKFSSAKLSDVLQLLADEAGMSFFSLPDDSEVGNQIVTFTINSSPFLALETLAKANGIALIYDQGIWYLRPETDTQLIGRVYEINYNTRELVTAQSSGSGGGSSSSGNGMNSNALTGIDLQGTTPAFETEVSKLLEDIRELLDIPVGYGGVLAGSTSVDSFSQGQGTASTIVIPQGVGSGQDMGLDNKDQSAGAAKVIWNSDANTLFVVGTRQQHQWIEGYLAASDKPQDQIAIEIKFFETSRDPSTEFGLDWTDTLDGGYQMRVVGDDGGEITSNLNLNNISNYVAPTTTILSTEEVNLKVRALVEDAETRTVSYPRMVTTNNREVKLRSVINQPVLASSTSASLGSGATTSQEVSYLPIGTVINLLPKKLGSGKVQLNVSLTISSIINEEIILGSSYPVASSRVYNAPIEVHSGYTVAIGGLDQANWTQTDSGVPGLRKLPLVGYAFKSRSANRERNSLMIFITPKIIEAENGGLPDEPESQIRSTPHDPPPPILQPDGSFFTGIEQIPLAIASLSREVAVLEQITEEYAIEKFHKERAKVLRDGINESQDKLDNWILAFPERADQLTQYDTDLEAIEDRLVKMQRKARWMVN